jgi:hypothetical protein
VRSARCECGNASEELVYGLNRGDQGSFAKSHVQWSEPPAELGTVSDLHLAVRAVVHPVLEPELRTWQTGDRDPERIRLEFDNLDGAQSYRPHLYSTRREAKQRREQWPGSPPNQWSQPGSNR